MTLYVCLIVCYEEGEPSYVSRQLATNAKQCSCGVSDITDMQTYLLEITAKVSSEFCCFAVLLLECNVGAINSTTIPSSFNKYVLFPLAVELFL